MRDATAALIPWLRAWGAWRSKCLTAKLGFPRHSPEQAFTGAGATAAAVDENELEKIDAGISILYSVGLTNHAYVLLHAYVHHKPTTRKMLDPAIRALAMALNYSSHVL
jgi:hypothetical protein